MERVYKRPGNITKPIIGCSKIGVWVTARDPKSEESYAEQHCAFCEGKGCPGIEQMAVWLGVDDAFITDEPGKEESQGWKVVPVWAIH